MVSHAVWKTWPSGLSNDKNLGLLPRFLSTESLGPCVSHGTGDHDQILQHFVGETTAPNTTMTHRNKFWNTSQIYYLNPIFNKIKRSSHFWISSRFQQFCSGYSSPKTTFVLNGFIFIWNKDIHAYDFLPVKRLGEAPVGILGRCCSRGHIRLRAPYGLTRVDSYGLIE